MGDRSNEPNVGKYFLSMILIYLTRIIFHFVPMVYGLVCGLLPILFDTIHYVLFFMNCERQKDYDRIKQALVKTQSQNQVFEEHS